VQTEESDLGYLAYPDPPSGREPDGRPGVVLIHDVWGLGEHFRDLARRLAGEGFAALALDLYRRDGQPQISDPGQWMRDLSDPQILADVEEATAWLARSPVTATAVGHHGVGVVGFCMGGMYSLMAACSSSTLGAAVPFYGLLSHSHGLLYSEQGLDSERKPSAPLELVSKLGCPLLAFFGDQDPYIPQSDVEELRVALQHSSQPAEVRVFEGAGHAFMNDTRPDAYHPESAQQAWAQTLEFLRVHLTGG
jgi:carboxymethylenebutenolidase